MKPTIQMTSTQLPASTITVRTGRTLARRGRQFCMAVAALAMLGLAGSVSAVAIPLSNAGFETPALADGGYNTTVTGWTIVSGAAGTFNPTTAQIPGQATEGSNTSYSNGSTISQTLGAVLNPGTYTLSVAVGDRSDTGFPGYQVQFGVMNGTAFVPLASESALVPSNGFLTSTVSYTAATGEANLGRPLVVRLVGNGNQVNFDDVRLDFAATPRDVAVFLQAQSLAKALPDGIGGTVSIPTWGFVCDPAKTAIENPDCVNSPSGPRINAFPGQALTVNLTNTLPTPVSITIPGQVGGGNPVMVSDTRGRSRVQSFSNETAAGSVATPSAPVAYTWNALRPGTYLYQSGTHPSIQVAMGLHGALIVGPATLTAGTCTSGQPAYDTVNSCHDADTVLLFSEIDPLQNERVAAASAAAMPLTTACVSLADYVANATVGYPCTVEYNPVYFLVNGEPYDKTTPPAALQAGNPGNKVLLRLLNAGLRSHAPAIVGLDMGQLAEDGNAYPGLMKQQSETLLPAGKTLDVLLAMPAGNATYALFDRMPASSHDELPAGGMIAKLQVGTGSTPPVPPAVYAVNDTYSVPENATPYAAAPGVLANDVGLAGATVSVVTGPANGTLTMNPDGTFNYTPNAGFSGSDGFTYSASLGGNSYPAQAMLNVSFVNDAPVAADDGPYVNTIGTTITVDAAHGVLGNDSDPDGDTLTAVLDAPVAGLTLNADGSFTYTGGTATTFSYHATDGVASSDSIMVALNLNPVANIVLTVQDPIGTVLTDYRWLVQEDATFHNNPSAPPPPPLTAIQSLNFHKSYMPVVAQGSDAAAFAEVALDPTKRYYVSVLPSDGAVETGDGHSIGGAQIPAGTSNSGITVFVNKQPIPTAQISVLVFNDNFPTNGAPDANEPGLGGFQITLEDAGGRYGISGGTMGQDAFGNPLKNWLPCAPAAAAGVILTCADGRALIKDLPPGKYGVIAVKPLGGPAWVQTSTIEGTKVIDAWVKAGEPPFFLEFGGVSPHAFIGFVDPATTAPPVAGSHSISGQVTLLHDPRPPAALGTFETGSYDALGYTRAWVGLNDGAGGGQNIRTVHAEPDGSFTLTGIPDGTYQIVVWDDYLDQIIAYQTVTVAGSDVALAAPIAVNAWFTRTEHNVFLDANKNGVRDPGEQPLPEQAINLRWRDGTVNQSFPTDMEGFVPFDQTFPFFSWQVLEVDYTRFKPTGVTVTVDAGGDVSGNGSIPNRDFTGLLNPQVQTAADGGGRTRTELGSTVLLQAFQGFPGQTSVFDWGKVPYVPGENGGISGIVFYGSTRGENDPRLTVGDPWEPGIPGVKVRLYREVASASTAIPVVNAGFEAPGLADGSYNTTVSGWAIVSGSAGTFNPTATLIPGEAAQGSNTSYSNGSTISQTLATNLAQGTYTLRVAVGDRTDTSLPAYQVQLGVMNGPTFVLLAEDNSSQVPNNGFLTSTVTYTAVAGNANLGLPLAVRLVGNGVQVNFDDVRLGYAAGGTALTLVQEVTTDSWDASVPTGCPGEDAASPFATQTLGVTGPTDPALTRCYDGFRNWNQARPGVFDGGYAFNDIPPGKYVVEVVPPPGYELIKEEDVNVGFGDAFATVAVSPPAGGPGVFIFPDAATVAAALAPEPGLAQPPCVGELRDVPPYLSLFPAVQADAPFAGAVRPLCNRKAVVLADQGQAAADFHLFTTTPVAAQFTGLVLDDISNEANPASPSFGEKWGPANLPISLRDYTGREVYRTYGDAFGRYNGVLPSTFTANIPVPSGYSPSMMVACMNDPGDGLPDPLRLTSYGTACYTAQFMPGTTTYLDTPVLPQAAFAGGFNPVDCAADDGTPKITQVGRDDALANPGPWFSTAGGATQRIIDIRSAGNAVAVPNPAYGGPLAPAPYNQPTITRDFGFSSTPGTVKIVAPDGTETPLTINIWNQDRIQAQIPTNAALTGELVVTRGDNGKSSINSVTVTVSAQLPTIVPTGGSIQAAIDAAAPGTLIVVHPGTYNEQVVMWKPVRLQGSGSDTIINATKRSTETLQAWIDNVAGLVSNGTVDLLPGQQPDFATEQGAGITVLAKSTGANRFVLNESRIDGFTITGADSGGGIFVNGYAHKLEIANNAITGNSGFRHGGIRVGHPFLPGLAPNANGIVAFNNNLSIHHNAITLNGAVGEQGAGGGLALSTGTNNYRVSRNFICGNYTSGDGAGIGHLGLSNNGSIEFNQILFNQAFNPTLDSSGAGIFIGGEPPVPPALTLGTGSVNINANLIQGNHAGSGHGGGVRTQFVNGSDTDPGTLPNTWRTRFTNNMIVNNVAAYAGGGISLQDTVNAQIINNTIADNDSTATVGGLIIGGASMPQPAGIAAERHSLALAAALGQPNGFSDPTNFQNNIVWHNRAFYYDGSQPAGHQLQPDLAQAAVGSCPAGANYWDLGVLGEPAVGGLQFDPRRSILTDTTGYHGSNLSGDPDFLSAYCNGARTLNAPGPMLVTAAFGEGGNFLDVRFGPLTQAWPAGSAPWDYHIGAASAGLNNGNNTTGPVPADFDGDTRPQGTGTPSGVDRGADEVTQAAPTPGTVAFNSSGAFGNVVFLTTETRTITATVSGGPVTFVSSTNPAAPFAKTVDTCSGTTVPTGGTCTFTVTYTQPLLPVTNNGSFTVTSNATGSPQTVNLSGTGVRQVAFTSATAPGTLLSLPGGGNLAFGNQSGLVTSTLTMTVEGSTPVTFGTLSVNNFYGTAFSKDADTCSGATLSGGGTCTVTVNFDAPTNNSFRGATLTAPHNGTNSVTQTLVLNGQ
jgi:parallel beta-helix repeat protein